MDEALQGLIWIRRCRGSCRSGAARAHANQALQTLMQLMRCKARRIASCEALREHQHEASISGFSIQVGGIGRQAFELLAQRTYFTCFIDITDSLAGLLPCLLTYFALVMLACSTLSEPGQGCHLFVGRSVGRSVGLFAPGSSPVHFLTVTSWFLWFTYLLT